MSGCQEKQFSVFSRPKSLDWLLARLGEFDYGHVPSSTWDECRLALAEGFNNVVQHAHQNLGQNALVTLRLQLKAHSFEIRIWDFGPPFDLDNYSADQDLLAESGRGIRILRQISEHLSYERQADGRNCLLIVIKIQADSAVVRSPL